MRKGEKCYVIRSAKQMAALAAAARQEILDVLAGMGSVSIAELAASLGRPPDALYFHIRALKQVGLVRQVGRRRRGGRTEALFRTVAPDLLLEYEPRNECNRKAVTAIVSSMLRLGIRDFKRAFERADAIVAGPKRELWALRKTARLSLAQIASLNQSIEQVRGNVAQPHGGGRLYGITILLTPLDHRRRETKRSKRSQRARTK